MIRPLVSVIIPTTHDRIAFNKQILETFIRQDYQNKRVFFDYGEGTIGAKRNRLCENADGDIIVSMDSDDYYSDQWITKSVEALISSEVDIVGLKECYFYDEAKQEIFHYTYAAGRPWVIGSTMVYWRKFWETTKFQDTSKGEDYQFTFGVGGRVPKIFAHDYKEGFLASIHEGNTCKRITDNVRYRICGEEEMREVKKRFFGVEANATI